MAEPNALAGDSNTAGASFRIGVAEDMNRRCRRTMEDAHAYVLDYNGVLGDGFFAIYDGHAGKQAAEWCGDQLHEVLRKKMATGPAKGHRPPTMTELLHETFRESENELNHKHGIHSGCTAVVAVVRMEQTSGIHRRMLYTANVGDARAVLCRNGKAVRLTYDHKGSDPQEIKRIIDQGGFIMNSRVNGVLAVTRSLGDSFMKELILSHPYTSQVQLTATDTFLILACDGVWDVMSDQEAVDLIGTEDDAQEAAKTLIKNALHLSSMDNLSCMVIRFPAESPAFP